jgi:hypothetical protein
MNKISVNVIDFKLNYKNVPKHVNHVQLNIIIVVHAKTIEF